VPDLHPLLMMSALVFWLILVAAMAAAL